MTICKCGHHRKDHLHTFKNVNNQNDGLCSYGKCKCKRFESNSQQVRNDRLPKSVTSKEVVPVGNLLVAGIFSSKIAEIEKGCMKKFEDKRLGTDFICHCGLMEYICHYGLIEYKELQLCPECKAKLQAFKEAREIVRKEIDEQQRYTCTEDGMDIDETHSSDFINAEVLKQALFGGEE